MKKVVIISESILHYRKDFFNLLRQSLLKNNVELTVIYGKIDNTDIKNKNDQVSLEWGKSIRNKILRIGKKELIWQPCLKELRGKDMVIVEQANRFLINYYLMFARRRLNLKFCFWGHGSNRQINRRGLFNNFKYLFIKNCDWWFAYTQDVKDFLVDMGFPANKITPVQNAINTKVLKDQYVQVDQTEVEELKKELNISSDCVGIYCGAMYTEKKIDFILEACYRTKKVLPNFVMIFIGAGPDLHIITEAAGKNDWIHSLGPKFGKDRVKYFKIAAVQIMPGAVGLGILDSFAMETPLLTTEQNSHGPEIYYLENEKNGLITQEDITEYTKAIIDLLISNKYLEMANYCRLSAEKYTIENMVHNFKLGILACLNSD